MQVYNQNQQPKLSLYRTACKIYNERIENRGDPSRLATGGSFHFVLRDLGDLVTEIQKHKKIYQYHNMRNTVVIMDLSVTKG